LAENLAMWPKRLIVLSSTSRFSKTESAVSSERALAERLVNGEDAVISWAEQHAVPWLILRPTLIHGFGRDRNVADIVRFIRRFGFFPLLGKACGMRRPVHAREVAQVCYAALLNPAADGTAITVSGGETLSYREMVGRIFSAMGRPPRILTVPRSVIALSLQCLHALGLARAWSIGMADRMNQDLAYEHEEARSLLGFCPADFVPDITEQ
jgi:nucleoside-diphosphate-sugar epimerase